MFEQGPDNIRILVLGHRKVERDCPVTDCVHSLWRHVPRASSGCKVGWITPIAIDDIDGSTAGRHGFCLGHILSRDCVCKNGGFKTFDVIVVRAQLNARIRTQLIELIFRTAVPLHGSFAIPFRSFILILFDAGPVPIKIAEHRLGLPLAVFRGLAIPIKRFCTISLYALARAVRHSNTELHN